MVDNQVTYLLFVTYFYIVKTFRLKFYWIFIFSDSYVSSEFSQNRYSVHFCFVFLWKFQYISDWQSTILDIFTELQVDCDCICFLNFLFKQLWSSPWNLTWEGALGDLFSCPSISLLWFSLRLELNNFLNWLGKKMQAKLGL